MSPFRVSAVVVVLLAAGACRKKVEPPPPPPTVPAPIRIPVQITQVNPGVLTPDTPAVVTVMGGGFRPGAQVVLGQVQGAEVVVRDTNTLAARLPGLPEGRYDLTVTNPDGLAATLRQAVVVQAPVIACRQATVFFAFDSNALDDAGQQVLGDHAACYQADVGAIRIEGHADERGTIDYNLALGQRRADAVAQTLQRLGVSSDKVTTVSYGEERPAVDASNEQAWAENRRAEILATE